MGSVRLSLHELIRGRVAAAAAELVERGQRVAVDGDADDVHRFRVAVRRLRSDLRTYASCLHPEAVDPVRVELSGLSDLIGELRNRDVLLQRMTSGLGCLGPDDACVGEALLARLDQERDAALGALRLHLLTVEYRQLTEQLDQLREALPSDRTCTDADIVRLAIAPLRRLERAVRRLGAEPEDAELHRVRILAKRARYATEAIEPAVGRPARRLARSLTSVQDLLGEHQDAVMAEAWLRAAAATEPPLGLVAGLLVAAQRHDAARTRAAFPALWERVRTRARAERAELARRFDR